MALTVGTQLGSYEITALLGKGGMGEVYRARDLKLKREVAIKILPDEFARDGDRSRRFQREAEVLAALNHASIAAIYDLAQAGETRFLVLELVEGETLADRVARGPTPVEDTLHIATQICEALEAAHERNIIHRDLKPANIKLTPEGKVKVLDFGLAKVFQDHLQENLSNAPTQMMSATMSGVILGTAAYMSPEQAKGKEADRTSDVWSFGCVLYEMLTGRAVFGGETVGETLAEIFKREPEWDRLPVETPQEIRRLLRRCLQKDPKQRLQHIGDARISLEEALLNEPEPRSIAPSLATWRLVWLVSGIASLFVLSTAVLAFLQLRQRPAVRPPMRFEIPLPANVVARGGFALSPDGGKLAFIGLGTDGQNRLWVRSLDQLVARPLVGTEAARDFPFWSPDGRFIVFFAGGKLKKIDISGGSAVELCDTPHLWGGGFSADGKKIVFGSPAGTQQVSPDGGPPLLITARGNSNTPSFLPDGRHFVYLDDMGNGETAIYMGSVDTRPQDQRFKKLLPDITFVSYAPSSEPSVGYLLFVRGVVGAGAVGTLMAQRFDTQRLEIFGDAVEVAEHVSNLNFSASQDVLVYVTGAGRVQSTLTWFDKQGTRLGNVGDPGFYGNLAISPDGKRVAFDLADPQNPGIVVNIWLEDFERGVPTPFTFDKRKSTNPVWSPDSSRIAFASNRESQFDLYEKSSNLAGEDELLFKSAGQDKFPSSWSRDGRFLSYFTSQPSGKLWVLPTSAGMDSKPIVERSDYNQSDAQFSPDGRWIAYLSDESGRSEIYMRSFDESSPEGKPAATAPGARKWKLSKNGGTSPRWRRDGRELFYLSPEGSAMAVDVTASGVSHPARELFKVPQGTRFWDVSGDGSRFLIAVPSGENSSAPAPFTVVSNWQAALKK